MALIDRIRSTASPEDTTLSVESVLTTLTQHGIAAYEDSHGVLWAYEEATRRDPRTDAVEDVSAWINPPRTARALAAWLGY
jgi:hypothetical protein